jgi:hypothetical protein
MPDEHADMIYRFTTEDTSQLFIHTVNLQINFYNLMLP